MAKLYEKTWALVRLGCKSLCRCLAGAARHDQNHLDRSSLWICHNQRERKITSTPTDSKRIRQREREREREDHHHVPVCLEFWTWQQAQGRCNPLMDISPISQLCLRSYWVSCRIPLPSPLLLLLLLDLCKTNHHPPLPNNKGNDGHTNKTNNKTSWDSFFPRILPLPKRVKRTRQAAKSPTKRKIAWWGRREYVCNSTRHRSIRQHKNAQK